MKNIFLVLILISIGFISCDGRKSRSEALKSSIKDFNEKQADVVVVSYYPKDYTEVVTDTIICNSVNVHIKNYSRLDKSLLISVNDKTKPKSKKEHRVFESDVVVSTPTRELLKIHISAEQFKSIDPDIFWNHATLQHVWVNQELSTIDYIKLDMSFINPSNNSYKIYRMSINKSGQKETSLIEERT